MNSKKKLLNRVRHFNHELEKQARKLKSGKHSNFDEEQILRRYISELLPADHTRTVVDLGAGDGTRWSNSFALVEEGWTCLGVEYDSHKFAELARAYRHYPNAFACRCRVRPDTITSVFEAYEVKENFDVLSLDIDSYDYWMLDVLLPRFRPRLVVAEVNEKIPPPIKFVVKYNPDFEMTHHFYGFSIASAAELCERHGYALLALEYNNVFLAPLEILTEKSQALTAEAAYRTGYAERADRREKFRQNFDMEILHTLSPAEGLKFIDEFYRHHAGEYEASIM
jgi:hypothetical protein